MPDVFVIAFSLFPPLSFGENMGDISDDILAIEMGP